MTPVELTTERLRLRLLRPEDRPAFARMNADPEVMRHFIAPMERHESNGLAERIGEHFAAHGFGPWAVEVQGGAPFVGVVGLWVPTFEAHFTPCVEIMWRLAREAWGHGYALEAAHEALRFAFEELALPEVVSFTVPANERSWRVMQRLGMQRDPAEDFDHPRVPKGHPLQRHVLYRMPRSAWSQTATPNAQNRNDRP